MIYLDNAAGSFPKPWSVGKEMAATLRHFGANPGRGNYELTRCTCAFVEQVRKNLAHLINAADATRVTFSAGATMSINQAIYGVLADMPGSHVVTTSVEHNAVLRPLWALERRDRISLSIAEADRWGYIKAAQIADLLRPETRLVVISHASNVCGSVQPIAEIGALCRERGVLLLVDAAQSAGLLPIDVQCQNISLLALAGHKALYGPAGCGALYVAPGIELTPLLHGGTGRQSEMPEMPQEYPARLEAGSLPVAALGGWLAGLRFIERIGQEKIFFHAQTLCDQAASGLRCIPRVTVFCRRKETLPRVPVLSFVVDGMTANEVAEKLDHAGIAVRAGYHCAPSAHRTLGTFEEGTVRISPGWYNTPRQINRLLDTVAQIIR